MKDRFNFSGTTTASSVYLCSASGATICAIFFPPSHQPHRRSVTYDNHDYNRQSFYYDGGRSKGNPNHIHSG